MKQNGYKEILCDMMKTSAWSGGVTTEIAIFPSDARYADRDFIWRASTASVNLDESDFTLLPNYVRLIASIHGTMRLEHDSSGEIVEILPRKTIHRFDGAAHTHCVGKARDINLMLRKGKADGTVEFLRNGERLELAPAPDKTLLIYFVDDNRAELYEGVPQLILEAESDLVIFSIWPISEA